MQNPNTLKSAADSVVVKVLLGLLLQLPYCFTFCSRPDVCIISSACSHTTVARYYRATIGTFPPLVRPKHLQQQPNLSTSVGVSATVDEVTIMLDLVKSYCCFNMALQILFVPLCLDGLRQFHFLCPTQTLRCLRQ